MKKIANFIVEKYKFIIVAFVFFTIIAAICSTQVTINTDLTKYLPDDSDMKIGMELMEEEFGETTSDSTAIRIMFTDLPESEKQDMVDTLEEIFHIDSVTYDLESEDYNKDNYTKYDLTVSGAYGSEEESAVEADLETEFQDYTMTYVVDDTAANSIPKTVLFLALGILVVILLIMSESWFEPVLFIVTIMMAIVMNLGTNLLLGTVSNTTSSLGPILQLVLSMDYSIILMNRYHQELEVTDNRKDAMKTAWMHAFNSISSSSLTTVVGLLALVFMSFKLGRDVGIVLAKGVFISVICVLTFLPGITMIATPLIQKTKKRVPIIPTGGLAKFSYKFRKVITPVFIILFIGVYFLQQNTELTYSMNSADEISEIFPKSQTVVMMYDNRDEDRVTELEDELENHKNVVSVTGYGNMLGKKNTVSEMKEHISNLGTVESDFIDSLDEPLLGMLYYDYFTNGEIHPMTAADFIQFLADDVVNGKTFQDQFDDSTKESIKDLKKYADTKQLTEPKSIGELAEFMNLDEDSCKQLFLMYYIENGGIETGEMTVEQFLNFMINDLAKDETYGSLIDKEQLNTIQNLMQYTNSQNMTDGKSYEEMADLLGMDSSTMQMLYVYYYANNSDYVPGEMTLPNLVSYLKNDIANNETFAAQLGADTSTQLELLSKFTNSSVFTSQMNTAQLAELFGLQESLIKTIMISDTTNLSGTTMSIDEFLGYMVNHVLTDEVYGSAINADAANKIQKMDALIKSAINNTQYDISGITALSGMSEDIVTKVFALYFFDESITLSPQQFVSYVLSSGYASSMDESVVSTLNLLGEVMENSASNTSYDYKQAASLFGMDESTMKMLYTYQSSADSNWKISAQTLLNYIGNNNAVFSGMVDASSLSGVSTLQNIVNSSVNGTRYSSNGMAELIGLDSSMTNKLYLLNTYKNGDISGWKLSVQKFVNFLNDNIKTNAEMAARLDEDSVGTIEKANTLINAVVSEKKYTAQELYQLIQGFSEELDINKVELIYLYHDSMLYSDGNWKLNTLELVDYLADDVSNDARFSMIIKDEMKDSLSELQETLHDAADSLRGKNYSRVLLRVKDLDNMDDINSFYVTV